MMASDELNNDTPATASRCACPGFSQRIVYTGEDGDLGTALQSNDGSLENPPSKLSPSRISRSASVGPWESQHRNEPVPN
jgi:hypothetical protein